MQLRSNRAEQALSRIRARRVDHKINYGESPRLVGKLLVENLWAAQTAIRVRVVLVGRDLRGGCLELVADLSDTLGEPPGVSPGSTSMLHQQITYLGQLVIYLRLQLQEGDGSSARSSATRAPTANS